MNESLIFTNALKLADSAERSAYMDRACANNATLRAGVEALLQAHASDPDFLENALWAAKGSCAPSSATTLQPSPPWEKAGAVLGPYTLLEQIGEGGMGVVYMAEQLHPVQRKVALKVIRVGMDSGQVLARFEAERQALALMDHPNIVKVLDAGSTPAGLPYFVMELVNGAPITAYCEENHLSLRARLELFTEVCQAVQHAHHKGVIHRDIKPSNVLVTLYDGKPVSKVIDFGVAKAIDQRLTEQTLFTQFGTLVGTLEYMSPEQAEMSAQGVDTRSDIYSLGVLLYELLTGSTPLSRQRLKEAAYAEILRLIREEEPPKPSTRLSDSGEALAAISANRQTEPARLTRLVRGELDWIVMKALEKDRNRRYETASGFAADMQRYLNDEPVLACPPSAIYRFHKFARRHRHMLSGALLLFVAVLVVAGTLGWAVRDRVAQSQEAIRDRVERQVAIEQEVHGVLKEAEQFQERQKWPEALSAVMRAEGLLAGAGSDELRQRVRLLRKVLETVLRLEEIPLLRSEWKENSFDYETADRAYVQAFRDCGIDLAALPVEEAAKRIRALPGVAPALVAALDDWAVRGNRAGQGGSLALTAIAQAADSDPWRRQVRQARQQQDAKALAALAASPELLRQPPTTVVVLAGALRANGLAEALVDLLRRAQWQHPSDFWINYELASALRESGPTYREEAVSFLRAALAVRPRSVAALGSLGNRLSDLGKRDEAITAYRRAIELDPTCSPAHTNLGRELAAQGKVSDAVSCYRKAIELNPKSASAYSNLGSLQFGQNNLAEAIDCYQKAIELDPQLGMAHNNLISILLKAERIDEALAACRAAITARSFKDADQSGRFASLLNTTAWRLSLHPDPKFRDPLSAIDLAKEAIERLPNDYGNWHTLGVANYRATKWQEALEAMQNSCKLEASTDGKGNAWQWLFMAMAHWQLGNHDEARSWYDKALRIETVWPTELRAFQSEAAELMGIGEAGDSQPPR